MGTPDNEDRPDREIGAGYNAKQVDQRKSQIPAFPKASVVPMIGILTTITISDDAILAQLVFVGSAFPHAWRDGAEGQRQVE